MGTATASRQTGQAILSVIGNTRVTPLRLEPEGMTLYAKCEFLHPIGSISGARDVAAAPGSRG